MADQKMKLLSAVAQTCNVPDRILHVCTPGYRLERRIKVAS